MSTQDFLQPLARSLGLRKPRLTSYEGRLVLITAMPCGGAKTPAETPGLPAGTFASFAQKNYYKEMVTRLKMLLPSAAEEKPLDSRDFRIFCNSSLPEKRFALESGLGLQGKNSLIYLPDEGSFFVLGGILFPPGSSRSAGPGLPPALPGEICGSCTACMDTCPGGAITAPGIIDRNRCIQGLAAEPGPLPAEIREKWGSVLYGCDICQNVCPLNDSPPEPAETEFGVLGPTAALEKILTAREGELRRTVFRGTVLDRAWISESAIKRNAVIGAARNPGRLLSLIRPYTEHPEAGLREAALWALRRFDI